MKKSSGLLDVTISAFDGAEVCKLVAIYFYSNFLKNITKATLTYIAITG